MFFFFLIVSRNLTGVTGLGTDLLLLLWRLVAAQVWDRNATSCSFKAERFTKLALHNFFRNESNISSCKGGNIYLTVCSKKSLEEKLCFGHYSPAEHAEASVTLKERHFYNRLNETGLKSRLSGFCCTFSPTSCSRSSWSPERISPSCEDKFTVLGRL